jgi:hypothetical protein
MPDTLNLNLKALLDFYDDRVPESVGHASAINAVLGEDLAIGLVTDYFRRRGSEARLVSRTCTQSTQKGVRLDAWLEITSTEGVFHYQTEIKNWSAHAIGGRAAPKGQSETEMQAYRINRWLNQFDPTRRTLKQAKAQKVLTPMKPEESDWVVRPLIIFWDSMHPAGENIPLFDVEISNSDFDRLWVFSMSSGVRRLLEDGVEDISLQMRDSAIRLDWLNRMLNLG